MSAEFPTDDSATQKAKFTANRLSIAHLLLWMTTTAAVLAFLQRHSPEWQAPFSSGNEAFDQAVAQSREVERWEFISLMGIAPAYGAALASAILAGWRLASGRRGFPVQPGHWLLLLIMLIPVVAALASLLDSLVQQASIAAIGLLYATGITAAAALTTRSPPRWHRAYVLTMFGMMILLCQLGLVMGIGPNPLSGFVIAISLLFLVSGLVAALGSSVLDLTARERFDYLHWTGVAVLFAAIVHVFVLWGINVAHGV